MSKNKGSFMAAVVGIRIVDVENDAKVMYQKWICPRDQSEKLDEISVEHGKCRLVMLYKRIASQIKIPWNEMASIEWLHWIGDITETLIRRYQEESSAVGFLSTNVHAYDNRGTELQSLMQHPDAHVIINALLDEVCFPSASSSVSDGGCGWPVLTEPTILLGALPKWITPSDKSILKRILSPPNSPSLAQSTITRVPDAHLPPQLLSSIPWRRNGIQYFAGEYVYIDQIEKLNVVIGKSVRGQILGQVWCLARLSGMPELVLNMTNARQLQEFQLHPCVKYSRFHSDRIVSFVPPDCHRVKLLSYTYLATHLVLMI
jgi:hypothetical protein